MTTPPIPSPEPLPCPCCGNAASADGVTRFGKGHKAWWPDGTRVLVAYSVNCMTCGLNNAGIVGGHQTREIAVEKWNRRVSSSSPIQERTPEHWTLDDFKREYAHARKYIDQCDRTLLSQAAAIARLTKASRGESSPPSTPPESSAAPRGENLCDSCGNPLDERFHSPITGSCI